MRWNEYFWGIICVCSDIQAGLAFYKRILFWFAFFGAWKDKDLRKKQKVGLQWLQRCPDVKEKWWVLLGKGLEKVQNEEKEKDKDLKDKKTEGGASMGCIGVNEMWFFKFMKWDEMSTFGESLVFVLM